MHQRNWIFFLVIIILLVICAFSAMTYWSFLVQEETLLRIENALKHTGGHVESLPKSAITSFAKEEYTNLLSLDPFTTQVLPKLRKDKKVEGTYRLGSYGKPENLSPFSLWSDVLEWYGLCVGSVARSHTGFYDRFAPDLAWKVERRDVPEKEHVEFWVHLQDGIFWEPLQPRFFPESLAVSDHFFQRHPVQAEDFLFYWNTFQNHLVDFPAAVTLRTLYAPLKALKVIDSKTFVVEVEKIKKPDGTFGTAFDAPQMIFGLRPLPRFVYLYHPNGVQAIHEEDVKKSSNFAQHFTSHFALNVMPSCNAWIFDGLTEEGINFRRNARFIDPYLAFWQRLSVRFYSTPDAMFRDFLAKNLDLSLVPREKLKELQKLQKDSTQDNGLKTLTYPARVYYYMGLNNQNPILASKNVRQALDFAIDKKRLIEQVLNSQGVPCNGPFLPTSENADSSISIRPYSKTKALELLAQDGWNTRNSEGIFEKEIDGKKVLLSFSFLYFNNTPIAKSLGELIALQLREIGVDCRLRGVEIAELSHAMEDKRFDSYVLGWGSESPPEKLEQLWHSDQAFVKGSSNTVGFVNKRIDALSDALKYESNLEKRQKMYHEAHKIIFEETPYIFLYFDVRTTAFWDYVKMVFIPKDRPDLTPGAQDTTPQLYFSFKE